VRFLSVSISIFNMHYSRVSIKVLARQIKRGTKASNLNDLERRRGILASRIALYNSKLEEAGFLTLAHSATHQFSDYLQSNEDLDDIVSDDESDQDFSDYSDDDDELSDTDLCQLEDEGTVLTSLPEQTLIWLPHRESNSLASIRKVEMLLQVAYALQHLEAIKECIGEKSALMQIFIRQNRYSGQKRKLRSWKQVRQTENRLSTAAAAYERARLAIEQLSIDTDEDSMDDTGVLWRNRLRIITKEDLKEVKDVTEPNRIGQKNNKLPWFWSMKEGEKDQSGLMQEGM
jgi:hypothetical protein